MKVENFHRAPLKVALMGLGRAMLNEHFPVFAAHPALFNVVAACDLAKERRDIVARSFPKCKMFRMFDDMLDERDIDLVIIALPAASRKDYVLTSLDRGFWTLVETPIALTNDEAKVLRGAAVKAKNRLAVIERGIFEPDFLLAQSMMNDKRLGSVYKIIIREQEYVRRFDWRAVKRTGGGAAFCQMPNLLLKALKLLPTQPIQMWSDLKRIASLGDVEDYVHVNILSRSSMTASIEYNGGMLCENCGNSFEIFGDKGVFSVRRGETKGVVRYIDPAFKFPRIRTTVRTPSLDDSEMRIPVVSEDVPMPHNTHYGSSALWKAIYSAVRTAVPLPYTIDDSINALSFVQLMRKSSQFGR